MAGESTVKMHRKCLNCGFEAVAGRGEWAAVKHPSLGTITQCPECGSTRIHARVA